MPKHYLLIVSEDPLGTDCLRRTSELALQLKARGHGVSLFLVQNGVLVARARSTPHMLVPLLTAAVEIRADEFSLRERGIEVNELRDGVTMAPIDLIVQRLAAGWHTLWS
jgi:sulfur relay (sulfurtransferase) complex TusBCD TusD component (DsrE family)